MYLLTTPGKESILKIGWCRSLFSPKQRPQILNAVIESTVDLHLRLGGRQVVLANQVP